MTFIKCIGGDCPKRKSCARWNGQEDSFDGIFPRWNFNSGECVMFIEECRTQNHVVEGKARSE